MKRTSVVVSLMVAAVMSCAVGTAFGQGMAIPKANAHGPSFQLPEDEAKALAEANLTPEQREALKQWNKRKVDAEKVMKTIRFKNFGSKNVQDIRQAGIAELRKITEPAAFPSMIEIYRDEQADVRKAVCEHLADLNTDQSLTTLAYTAVFERKPEFRQAATDALKVKLAERKSVPAGVHTVVASGLDNVNGLVRGDAARLASTLKLVEAIPAMIAAQISPSGGGSAGGYIAYIVVGTQRAYVADLDPVVGDNSVAFDPVPGVITEGTVLAINDAVAIQYHTGVHDALVGLTSGLSGDDTSKLGWNPKKWQTWYAGTLVPKLQAQKAAAEKAQAEQKPPTTMGPTKRPKGVKGPPIAV
ncbi:MAG: HEAT repeat domain-containing protein [Phycisphaerales bacterium]